MAVRLLEVWARRAEASEAGEVRESRWRERRERVSQLRQAERVVAFMVWRAEERAFIRIWDSELRAGRVDMVGRL